MKLIILLAMFLVICSYKQVHNANITLFIKDNLHEKHVSNFFAKLLLKYKDYLIIFHAETQTIRIVDSVIGYFNYKAWLAAEAQVTNFYIYNHDLKLEKDFTRRNASKIVNILFFTNTNFWLSLSRYDKINYNDVVIVVGGYRTLYQKVQQDGEEFVKIAGKVLLIEIAENRSINVYDICYYCGIDSMRFHLIVTTNTSSLKAPVSEFMPQKLKNLNGHLLKVVFISYFPYVSCKTSQTSNNETHANETSLCQAPAGTESEMLKVLSTKLNFTYDVLQMQRNVSYVNLIKYISARKADIAFGGISMTADRIPLVQFTKQYNTEDFTFLYLIQLTLDEVFDKFIEPFNAISVWSLYVVVFFILSLLLYIALKIGTDWKYKSIPYYESVWILFRIIFEQSHPNLKGILRSRLSTAIVLSLWWYASIIFNTTYKSTMLSTVVNPASMEPDNLHQLIKAGYTLVGNRQFSDIIKDLLLVPDPLYRQSLSQISYGTNTCNVFEKIFDGQVAMLDETSTIQYEIRTDCHQPRAKIVKWLRIGREAIRSTGHAWVMQRGAPFKQAMDYYINLILSGGHFKRWKNDVTNILNAHEIPKTRQVKPKNFRRLSITRFFPVLVIYLVGVSIATLCFFMEIIYMFMVNRQYRMNYYLQF